MLSINTPTPLLKSYMLYKIYELMFVIKIALRYFLLIFNAPYILGKMLSYAIRYR